MFQSLAWIDISSLLRFYLSTSLTPKPNNISCSGSTTMSSRQLFSPRFSVFLLAVLLLSGCFAGPKKDRILERADSYFKAGDFEKAKIEYLNVLRVDSQSSRAFQQVGFIWMEEGVPLRAVPFLLRTRELTPTNTVARAKLAEAFMAVGQPVEARKEAIAVLAEDPSNSDALIVLADASQNKEEIAATEQQLEKFPNKNAAPFHIAKASLARKKEGIGAASNELQEALKIDPKSARAHLLLGYLYLLRKDETRAAAELKTAAELAPPRSEEQLKYAEFLAANGKAEDAKTALQKITKDTPDYIPAWRDLAQIAVTEKKYEEALKLLENNLSRDPQDPDARLLQAQIWLANGETGKATFALDRINNDFPNNAIIKYSLARAYMASNNPAQATLALEQAVASRPDYVEAVLMLAELNLRSGKTQPVATAMEELLKQHPDLPQARALLASAYQLLGRLDDAANLFREQIKATPEAAEAYLNYGAILRRQKKDQEARQAFEKAAEFAPDNLTAIDQLVEMDLADKNYEAAAQRVQEQRQKHPNTAGLYFLEGKIYIAHGTQRDWAKAEEALQKAVQANPNFIPAYELLASAYYSENKIPEAIRQLDAEQSAHPGDPRPLLIEGMMYERMKDYSKSREAYEKVLTLDPNSLVALNNLAVLYVDQLNDFDKAYEFAQKARASQPGNDAIADTLGWVLYKRGEYQQALPLLQESVNKDPENGERQFHLGMACYMMGQGSAARAALEKAVAANSDFTGKNEARSRLAQLQNAPAGQPPGAQEQPATTTTVQSNDLIALLREADGYERQGDAAKAAATYEKAFKLNPKLATTAVKLAELNAGPLHQPARALELARKAKDLAPNDPKVGGAVGRVALRAGNISWAYSVLQDSARRAGNDPSVLHDLAIATYAVGKVSEARQTMQRAIDAKPTTADMETAKQFLAMTGTERPSQGEIEAVLKTEPDYLPALMAQGGADLQQNNPDKASKIFQDILRKYPDFAPAQKQLAAIYAVNPNTQKQAYDLAMKARKTLVDDPELARTLGEITYKRNEFSYAVQLLQESAAKQPLPAIDLYYLGMAQLQSREEAKGRETLQQALAAGLQEPLAQEAKNRLAGQQPK